MQYFPEGWYPVSVPRDLINQAKVGKARSLSLEERKQVAIDYGKFSLRQLAGQYGVSYETIRRTVLTQNTG